MKTLYIGKYTAGIKRIYKEHYPLFLFVLLSGLLIVGYGTIERAIVLSTIVAILLSIGSILYYYNYFYKFKYLTDIYSNHRQYYYDIYSVWGVLFFNCLFLCVFAFIAILLTSFNPNIGFGNAKFTELMKFLAQTVVDGLSFGILGAFSISLSNVELHTLFARSYMYATKLIIDLAFLTSAVSIIGNSIKSKREVRKVFDTGRLDKEFFSMPTPDKIKQIVHSIKSGKIKIGQKDSELVFMLANSSSKEARDIMLQIFQCNNNTGVLKSCVEYFQKIKDPRFKRVCRKIKDPQKRELLESMNIYY